jgi:dTDP-6-deoxy-L-talose 4-dehydrogenase (NAD+)
MRHIKLDHSRPSSHDYEALGRPEVVIHLAWEGLPNYRSLHHFETELPRQYAFLKGAVEGGVSSLVVAGTCYEYGMINGELSESADSRPANAYGFAKDSLRRQLEFLQARKPFGLTWARLFYMHGEGQAETSLLPQLAAAIARGDRSFPMSGGEQLRDYLPVEKVAAYLVDLALGRSDCGVVNVCSGRPTSIRKLVEQFLGSHGSGIALELGRYAYPDYEPMAFWGSTEKLRELISALSPGSAPSTS